MKMTARLIHRAHINTVKGEVFLSYIQLVKIVDFAGKYLATGALWLSLQRYRSGVRVTIFHFY